MNLVIFIILIISMVQSQSCGSPLQELKAVE
jgi:quercetin 2,3-dioxygenase